MYADKITDSMNSAITETNRRREIQHAYNVKNNIVPKTIYKDISDSIVITQVEAIDKVNLDLNDMSNLSAMEKKDIIAKLEKEMKAKAKELNFEEAMALRDLILEIKSTL